MKALLKHTETKFHSSKYRIMMRIENTIFVPIIMCDKHDNGRTQPDRNVPVKANPPIPSLKPKPSTKGDAV